MADDFGKFTERARKVLQFAQEEAIRLGHDYIGLEHFPAAFLLEGDGIAAQVLLGFGLTVEKIRDISEQPTDRHGKPVNVFSGLTQMARVAIERSVEEARRMHIHYISTEHLLLGFVFESNGHGHNKARKMLEGLGVTEEMIRTRIQEILSPDAQKANPVIELVEDRMGTAMRLFHGLWSASEPTELSRALHLIWNETSNFDQSGKSPVIGKVSLLATVACMRHAVAASKVDVVVLTHGNIASCWYTLVDKQDTVLQKGIDVAVFLENGQIDVLHRVVAEDTLNLSDSV